MELKKIVIPMLGIGATITSILLLKSNSKMASNMIKGTSETLKEVEKTFGGVSLSELNELAKTIYHGVKVTVDQYGYLIFHYTSNSRKTAFDSQIYIDEFGKLVSLGGHYPGQWRSSADVFVKKANELFSFQK